VKRLLFASAVACLFAVNALAADPPVTTTAPPVTTGPVTSPVIGTSVPAPVMTTSRTTSTRRGLFGRLRNRSSAPVYSTSPLTTGTTVISPAPVVTPGTVVPTPMPTPSPMPSPGTTGINGGASGVVTTSGITPDGVMMSSGTTAPMVMAPTTTQTSPRRMGLIARLRARR
jgi:hypothetical protein